MQQFTVEFFETAKGEKPVEEFLLSLDMKMRAKQRRKEYLERKRSYEKFK